MATAIPSDIRVIDVDTHVTEPADLWTSRVSTQRWGDQVPHVKARADGTGLDGWFVGDKRIGGAPAGAHAAWVRNEPSRPPSQPANYEDVLEATYAARPRLHWMDEHGIWAQVIYPNVGGFGASQFLKLPDDELRLSCVRAYNDFLAEWCADGAGRLIPVAALPLWDIPATLTELQRVIDLGHRGILLSNRPETMGLPLLSDEYWDPIWDAAQAANIAVNFHIAGGDLDVTDFTNGHPRNGLTANYARGAVLFFMDNSRAVTEIITAGICHRYPRLKLVSVESGIGWAPFVMEAMDWQWRNMGVYKEHPEYELLPSEYFRQNWHACFWFEQQSPRRMLDYIGVDNVLFETDFPHPTSLTPGPTTAALSPREHMAQAFDGLPAEWTRKILHENPARLYGIS